MSFIYLLHSEITLRGQLAMQFVAVKNIIFNNLHLKLYILCCRVDINIYIDEFYLVLFMLFKYT